MTTEKQGSVGDITPSSAPRSCSPQAEARAPEEALSESIATGVAFVESGKESDTVETDPADSKDGTPFGVSLKDDGYGDENRDGIGGTHIVADPISGPHEFNGGNEGVGDGGSDDDGLSQRVCYRRRNVRPGAMQIGGRNSSTSSSASGDEPNDTSSFGASGTDDEPAETVTATLVDEGEIVSATRLEPQDDPEELQRILEQFRDEGRERIRKMRKRLGIVLVSATVVVVIIAVAVSLTTASPQGSPPDLDESEKPGDQIVDPDVTALKGIVSSLSSAKDLADPASPQSRALEWILGEEDLISPSDELRVAQRYSLAVLYYSTNGPSWPQQFQFLSPQHECNWTDSDHILAVKTCSDDEFVKAVDFSGTGMVGTIPTEFAHLTNVSAVRFMGNRLSGTLPTELGGMKHLSFLSLVNNKNMEGTIPTELGALPLSALWLPGNGHTGTIPSELGNLDLKWGLSLRDNALTGTIPQSLASFDALSYMEVQGNDLQGSAEFLCDAFGVNSTDVKVDKLSLDCSCCACCESASLTDIKLSGLRSIVSNLSSPDDLANPESAQSRALDWLLGEDNPLSPDDKVRVAQRYSLVVLYYSTNGPQWREQYQFLTPEHECDWADKDRIFAVKSCSDDKLVTSLDFSDIGMVGSIPTEFGHLTQLAEAGFLGNDLSGSIPTEIGRLVKLIFLSLVDNKSIGGTIPTELGALPLQALWLSKNSLTGMIPSELGNLELRWGLSLKGNKLSGTIPSSLGSYSSLSYMELQDNDLGGSAEFLCEAFGSGAGTTVVSVDKRNVSCSCCDCCGR